jgi:hypothetical protein
MLATLHIPRWNLFCVPLEFQPNMTNCISHPTAAYINWRSGITVLYHFPHHEHVFYQRLNSSFRVIVTLSTQRVVWFRCGLWQVLNICSITYNTMSISCNVIKIHDFSTICTAIVTEKWVIRGRQLKYRQYNGQKKKDKRTNNYLQNTTHNTKDRYTWTPSNTGVELRCYRSVFISCSTSGTRRVTLVTNPGVVSFSELTWLIRYIYFWNLQFLNNVIITKTKVPPPCQA